MRHVFYITPTVPLVLLLGGLAVLFAFLSVVSLRRPSFLKRLASLSELFGPFGRIHTKTSKAVYVFTTALLVFMLVTSSMVYVSVHEDRVEACVPFFLTRRTVFKEDVVRAFIADWREEGDLRPVLRTCGAHLGDYRVGWHLLANGERALLLSLSPVNLVLETREGYYILMSPPDFEVFVEVFESLFSPAER